MEKERRQTDRDRKTDGKDSEMGKEMQTQRDGKQTKGKTDGWKDREIERQRVRETELERLRDRETERRKDT